MTENRPKVRVLIADDMQFFRLMIKDLLTDQGFDVVEAKDGREAMEIIRREHPTLSLALVDMVMPGKDGADVLREVRANPRTERLPIIIVTGNEVTAEQREELRAMGATGFLSKAMPSKEMLFRVQQLVEEHAQPDQAASEGVPVNMMVDYLTESGAFSALCYRLSSQWLDLRTIQPLPVGSTTALSFELPGSSEPLQVRGKVIETRPGSAPSSDGSPPGMRVQFLSDHAQTLNEIRDFVQGKPRRA